MLQLAIISAIALNLSSVNALVSQKATITGPGSFSRVTWLPRVGVSSDRASFRVYSVDPDDIKTQAQLKTPEDFKVNSQIARLNALAAKLRSEAAALEAEQKQAAADTLAKAFKTFDTNNDGEISLEELKEGLAIALYSSISEEQATKLMQSFDTSGDGALQLDEFQGIEAFRRRLDSLLREEKQSAVEAQAAAKKAKDAAEQAEAIAELINNQPPTVTDKLASLLPYMLPLLDSLPYGANVLNSMNLEGNPAFSLLTLLFSIYQTVPFTGLIAFFFFNTLSTNLRLNRLVRFNIQQAIYLDISLIIPGLVGPLIVVASSVLGFPVPAEVSTLAATATFATFIALLLYSVLSSLFGIEPDKIPFVSTQVKKRVPTTEEFRSMFDDEGNFKPIKKQIEEQKKKPSDSDSADEEGGDDGDGEDDEDERSSSRT